MPRGKPGTGPYAGLDALWSGDEPKSKATREALKRQKAIRREKARAARAAKAEQRAERRLTKAEQALGSAKTD